MISLIVIEGVLAQSDNLKTAMPRKTAGTLYEALRSQTNTIALTRSSAEVARWWLKREHLEQWSNVLSYPDTKSRLTWDRWRVDMVRQSLADSWEIFGYVDTNPIVISEVRLLGVSGIQVSYPTMPVGWKESEAPRAWDSIVTTLDETMT